MPVVQPSDRLADLDRALVKRQRSDWARLFGASVVGGGVGAAEGPSAGIKAGLETFRSPREGFTPQETIALKKGVADAMAKYAKDMADTKLTTMEKMSKKDELFKAILEAAMKAHGADVGAMSAAGESVNRALVGLNQNWTGAIADVVKNQSPANATQIESAFNRIRDAMAGSPSAPQKDVTTDIMNTLTSLRASGDDAGAEALIAKLELAAPTFGIQSFNGWLDAAARAEGPAGPAAIAYEAVKDIGRTMDTNNSALLEAAKADKDATIRSLKTMVPGADKALETATAFYERFKDIDDPEQITKAINDVLGGPNGENPSQPLEPFMKMLEQIDNESIPAASNFAEARRRFLADPEFQQWMKDNGFQPGSESVALHELHRIAKERVYNAKQNARQLVASRVQGNVTAQTGAPSVSSKVVAVPGASGETKPSYDPGWVLDEEFNPWFYGEDGKLRQPTPDELDQLDKDIEAAGGGEKGLKAVVRSASEFASLKSASDKQNSSGLIAEARKRAADVKLPELNPTLASTATEIGYGIVNPRAGLQMLKNEFKKKKPPTPPILDEMQAQVPE